MAESFEGPAILGVAFLAYGGAEIIGGNGFIAAFVAGLVLGNLVRDPRRTLADWKKWIQFPIDRRCAVNENLSVSVTTIGSGNQIGGRNRGVCSSGANPCGVSCHGLSQISGDDDASSK